MTRTALTYRALLEVAHQFIDDYQLPDPSSIHYYVNAGMVSILIDAEHDITNTSSEALDWRTNEVGITTARLLYDGVQISVQVFEP